MDGRTPRSLFLRLLMVTAPIFVWLQRFFWGITLSIQHRKSRVSTIIYGAVLNTLDSGSRYGRGKCLLMSSIAILCIWDFLHIDNRIQLMQRLFSSTRQRKLVFSSFLLWMRPVSAVAVGAGMDRPTSTLSRSVSTSVQLSRIFQVSLSTIYRPDRCNC